MKTLPISLGKITKVTFIAAMVMVLTTQSTVQAQSVTMSTNELKALTAKIKTEVERRIAETKAANEALTDSNAIAASAKNAVFTALQENEKKLKEFLAQIEATKDMTAAKELAAKVDAQYDQFASANASSLALKDSDTQQEAFKQLEKLKGDIQTSVDKAGASGQNVDGQQDVLKTLTQLIQTIGAIIASVVALIVAVASGNFTAALTIFQSIIGQLAQNMTSIAAALQSAQGLVGSINITESGVTAGNLTTPGTGSTTTTPVKTN